MSDADDSRTSFTSDVDVSIVICTRNRADSLSVLLRSLSNDDMSGIRVEIVVVDNNSEDGTQNIVDSFGDQLSIRYVFEERPGKCHALNRALDEVVLGGIIVFIDDDLVIERGWVMEVKATCARWPKHDIFGGRCLAEFPPDADLPSWASDDAIRRLAFSVIDYGERDVEIRRGHCPAGGFFWIRSRVLANGRRFPELWLCEPGFLLGLQEDGYSGVWSGSVVAKHRIQRDLLQPTVILRRVARFGREYPYARMPNPGLFWQARLFRDYPYVSVPLCLLNSFRWSLQLVLATFIRDSSTQFRRKIQAVNRLSDNWEVVRHWRRLRRFSKDQWRRGTAKAS